MSLRVFLALDFDERVKKQLLRLQERLAGVGAEVRWVKAEHIHLTMKFLGDVADSIAADVCRLSQNVAAEFEPFEFTALGAGCFSNHGRPRVIWVGVEDPSGSVRRLHDRIETTLAPLGLRRELRAFKPHVTLGRVRSARSALELRAEVERNKTFRAGTQQGREITIYSSQLSPEGPIHTVMSRAAFGGEPASPTPNLD